MTVHTIVQTHRLSDITSLPQDDLDANSGAKPFPPLQQQSGLGWRNVANEGPMTYSRSGNGYEEHGRNELRLNSAGAVVNLAPHAASTDSMQQGNPTGGERKNRNLKPCGE
jgi:hypothetical protein